MCSAEGDDGKLIPLPSQLPSRLVAVEDWHLHVHQNDTKGLVSDEGFQRKFAGDLAVFRDRHQDARPAQQDRNESLVVWRVFRQQHAYAIESARCRAGRDLARRLTKQGRCNTRWMLNQSAHAVRAHSGPLGHFFRRLKKRKPHNVAAVAVAHKLALLAWHVLTKGEPYRYALPQATENKLRRLRIQATGEKRRPGLPPGTKAQPARLPGGSHRIKPLPEVYASEAVPSLRPASAGERRHLAESKLNDFADGLQQAHIVPLRRTQEEAAAKSR